MAIYRLVADYGYGDKAWVERFLSAEQAVNLFNNRLRLDLDTIEECLDYDHPTHSIEEDHYGDTEDWDWMDS